MHGVRGNVAERLEHESPFVHSGVRQYQPLGIHDGIVVQQQIEVKGARPPPLSPPPAKPLLDFLHEIQQLERAKLRSDSDDCVEIVVLARRPTDRLGAPELAGSLDPDAISLVEGVDRSA
jgi:hypothetical protein